MSNIGVNMRLSFRQGIVSHQTDTLGTPTFLVVNGGYVSLMTTNDPTIVSFIHGQKDYLYTEAQTQNNAWGPFVAQDYWLFWQLNTATGMREFGSTTLEPTSSIDPPATPGTGQMWFNTLSNIWYEFSGASWIEVIRVFACKLVGGVTPVSMSINAPDYRGTQVGINTPTRSGALTYDMQGKAIRTGDRKFFTTEDQFFTNLPTGARLRVGNILVPGIAQQPLHRYQVVQYVDFNQLLPAVPFTQMTQLYGIIEDDAAAGESVDFVTEGMIFNEGWDWVLAGGNVNDPVFIDDTGEIQLTPHIGGQMPVGVITGAQEIMFAPRLFSYVEASISFDIAANFVGAPSPAQFIWHQAITRDMEIAGSTSTEHQGYAEIPPAGGDAIFELYTSELGGPKVSRGTFTFASGSKVISSQNITDITGLGEGDSLHLQCVTDFGISDVAITLKGHTTVFWKP